MGVFGSNNLAVIFSVVLGSAIALTVLAGLIRLYWRKRTLRKLILSGDIEAGRKQSAARGLRKSLHGEGHLFGVRAIESGFYGGVAQSRPTSRAESTHSPQGSQSSTLIGGRMSPKLVHISPNASVISLPLSARVSSPLRQTITADGTSRSHTPALVARPGRSRLRAWEVENAMARPSTANTDIGIASTRAPSPTPPIASRHQRIGSDDGPPRLELAMNDFRVSFRSIFPAADGDCETFRDTTSRQSARSFSRPISMKRRSRSLGDLSLPQSPAPVYDRKQSFIAETKNEQSFSGATVEPRLATNGKAAGSAPAQRVSNQSSARNTVGNWGHEIFKEIDKTMEISRSITASPEKEYQHSHSSSSSSSIYSLHDDADLLSRRSGSPESQNTYSSTKPFVAQAPRTSSLGNRPSESPTLGVFHSTPSIMHASKASIISISKYKPSRSDSAISSSTPTATTNTTSITPSRKKINPKPHVRAPSGAVSEVYDSYWDMPSSRETSKHQMSNSLSLTSSNISRPKINSETRAVPLASPQSQGASTSSLPRPVRPKTISLMPKPDPRQKTHGKSAKRPTPLEMEVIRGMAPQPQKVVLVEGKRKVVSGAAIKTQA